ncbi:uncharacterized protein N7483_003419 [Penicillium malachiteum]|uniref:uncharacterized protein n=1 Tax=Penicillium malachiteum TaxID=1324776 RepID=UPI002548DE63|nr:uncharacterized protein N7483_003419 [Penicillium malachiteum]KAJ5728911.1 hypothetical protein N7483_003419 [Penicillium malachiteum]
MIENNHNHPTPSWSSMAASNQSIATSTASTYGSQVPLPVIFGAFHTTDSECWACSAPRLVDVCHVVPQEDPQVILNYSVPKAFSLYVLQSVLWERCYLFNFDYESEENAIVLCPYCHRCFERTLDPGFVFFPVDIRYFIDFELSDIQRRTKIATEQTKPMSEIPRWVPSAQNYHDHEVMNNGIFSEINAGRYRRIFL